MTDDDGFDPLVRDALLEEAPRSMPDRLRVRIAGIPDRPIAELRGRRPPFGAPLVRAVAALVMTGSVAAVLTLALIMRGGSAPGGPTGTSGLVGASASASPSLSNASATPSTATASPSAPSSVSVPGTPMAVAFFDDTHGLVVGSAAGGNGAVWRTVDGGRTWTGAQSPSIQLALAAVAGDRFAWTAPRCVTEPISAIGCSLLASQDGGQTWQKINDGMFDALSFVDAAHGWAIGMTATGAPTSPAEDGIRVVATTDGGRTWTAIDAAPCSTIGVPKAVSFVSATHGWVGCGGMPGAGQAPKGIAETTDGGRTWTVVARATPPGGARDVGSIEMGDYLAGISMRPSGVGILWESRGGTFRTSDGGRTWQPMPPGGTDAGPVPGPGQAITDADWVLLSWDSTAGQTGLMVTHDAGRSWATLGVAPAAP